MKKNILQAIQLTALTLVLMFGGLATTEAFGEYGGEDCYGCYDTYLEPVEPIYDDYIYDTYLEPVEPVYEDYSYDTYLEPVDPVYTYSTPSYSIPSYTYTYPSTSSFIPSYSGSRSYSAPSRSFSTGGSSRSIATSKPVINVRGGSGGSSTYPVYIPTPISTPAPKPQPPIVINTPTPAPVASAPITITNNNVNNNVNNNTPAPVYTPPVVAPKPVTPAPQCAIYATASEYQGAKVTLSWATEFGDSTEIYCTKGVLGNKRVSPIDTQVIYPWESTTCYAVVKNSSTGASKTCSVYIPVEKPKPTYVPPVVKPTYTPPVVVQQPVYTPPTPTYTPPTVTLASTIVPTYESRTVLLSETPYTGFDDPIWIFTYIALIISAGYALYAYYPAIFGRGGREKFSLIENY